MEFPLKYKGKISISRPSGGQWDDQISITVIDELSRARFLEIKIDAKEMMLALTGLSEQEMTFDVRALDKVGKHVIGKTIEFEVPKDMNYNKRHEIAYDLCKKAVQGTVWVASDYYGSKDSFFERDGKKYARAHVRAYLNDEEYAAHKAGIFLTEGQE